MPLKCSVKVVYQVVNLFKKDQRTVIHFLGAGLELLKILGRCIPSVVLLVITYSGGGLAMYVSNG
jgi:hypothetical protein